MYSDSFTVYLWLFALMAELACMLWCLKGFGFVTFAHGCDADLVLQRLDGTVIEGRKIEVKTVALCYCCQTDVAEAV